MSMYPQKKDLDENTCEPPPPYECASAPPHPQYPQHQAGPQMVQQQPVVIEQPIFITTQFGDTPIRTVCPNCTKEILTRVQHENSGVQHLACLVMFVFGFWLCSCIPYCMDSLNRTRHTCPNCRAHIGTGNGS